MTSKRITSAQKTMLIDFMEANPELALSGSVGSEEYDQLWNILADKLNSEEDGGKKALVAWKDSWKNFKKDTRKKLNRLKRHHESIKREAALTEFDLRVYRLCGFQRASRGPKMKSLNSRTSGNAFLDNIIAGQMDYEKIKNVDREFETSNKKQEYDDADSQLQEVIPAESLEVTMDEDDDDDDVETVGGGGKDIKPFITNVFSRGAEAAECDPSAVFCKSGSGGHGHPDSHHQPADFMAFNVSNPQDVNDEDSAFFNSVLPHVRKLASRDKLLFRMKVQQVLFDLAYPQ